MEDSIYYRLNKKQLELAEKVRKVTITDYELKGEFIPVESLYSMIEDLLMEVERLQEELDYEKQDKEDNYRPLTYAEMGWE